MLSSPKVSPNNYTNLNSKYLSKNNAEEFKNNFFLVYNCLKGEDKLGGFWKGGHWTGYWTSFWRGEFTFENVKSYAIKKDNSATAHTLKILEIYENLTKYIQLPNFNINKNELKRELNNQINNLNPKDYLLLLSMSINNSNIETYNLQRNIKPNNLKDNWDQLIYVASYIKPENDSPDKKLEDSLQTQFIKSILEEMISKDLKLDSHFSIQLLSHAINNLKNDEFIKLLIKAGVGEKEFDSIDPNCKFGNTLRCNYATKSIGNVVSLIINQNALGG